MRNIAGVEQNLLNSWVLIREVRAYALGSDGPPQSAIGYMYVDHQSGITVTLVCMCEEIDDSLRVADERFMIPGGRMILLRFGTFDLGGTRALTSVEVEKLELCLPPHWESLYKIEKYEWILRDHRFDAFRAPGFPHDIRILLAGGHTEELWGRLEHRLNENKFVAKLLNEPYQQETGLHYGDAVEVAPILEPDLNAFAVVQKLTAM